MYPSSFSIYFIFHIYSGLTKSYKTIEHRNRSSLPSAASCMLRNAYFFRLLCAAHAHIHSIKSFTASKSNRGISSTNDSHLTPVISFKEYRVIFIKFHSALQGFFIIGKRCPIKSRVGFLRLCLCVCVCFPIFFLFPMVFRPEWPFFPSEKSSSPHPAPTVPGHASTRQAFFVILPCPKV